MIVKLTLDVSAGTDLDNFDLYYNPSYTTKLNITPVTRAQLLSGHILTNVPNGTTTIRVTPTGACGNSYDSTVTLLVVPPLTPIISRLWNSVDISSTGQYQTAVVYGGLVYRSIDYGVTWTEVSTMLDNNFISVSLSDSGQYQTALSDVIFRSTDFGVTWAQNYTSELHISIHINDTGQNQLKATQLNYLQLSTDYGVSFSALTASGVESWNGAIMTDNAEIIVGSTGSVLHRSIDFGATFSQIAGNYNYYILRGSSTLLYQLALVNGGYMRRSTDYGATWANITGAGSRVWTGADISSTGQYQTAITGNYIYRSIDFGVNWTELTAAGNKSWKSVSMSTDGQYQTAIVNGGYIHRSIDYGATWTELL